MDVFEQLRQKFDGADSFVAGGHAVRGGGATSNAERIARTPKWANDDVQVRLLLLKVFPKLATDDRQRKRAAIWLTVIYLYFRRGLTHLHISMKMGWSLNKVKMLVRAVKYAADGKAVAGHGKGIVARGKPRGRPKKNTDTLQATIGSPGRDHISL